MCDTVRRDIISKEQFELLMGISGIGNNTTVILYGDNNNWFAAWALWQLKIYGHKDVRLMNGGRKKWLAEGRELSKDVLAITTVRYQAKDPDFSAGTFRAPRTSPGPRPATTTEPSRAPINQRRCTALRG